MTSRMHGAFVASLSIAALLLSAKETFAAPQGVRGRVAATRSIFHPLGVQSLRHHHRKNFGAIFWPGVDDFSNGFGSFGYGPSGGQPLVGGPPPSGDVHYTYTYDVPWDWAHRLPPNVTPSDRPYVSSCPVETVKLPGRDGEESTVNVMRCY